MKKTFLFATALLCLLSVFALTGCPPEPELSPWEYSPDFGISMDDLDGGGVDDDFKHGDFSFEGKYRAENGDTYTFWLGKNIEIDETQNTYSIRFTFEGDTGDWDSDSGEPYFDRAYFKNGYVKNEEWEEYSGKIEMKIPSNVTIDRVYDEGEPDQHVYLSEWLPYKGNYSAGDEWVMMFESDAHHGRSASITVPANIVSATMEWVNTLDEKTKEFLLDYYN